MTSPPDLSALAGELATRLVRPGRQDRSLSGVVSSLQDPCIIKSYDGQVLSSNKLYDSSFGGGECAIGRYAACYLDQEEANICELTDEVIRSGSRTITFECFGELPKLGKVVFDCVKTSVTDAPHPKVAILCLFRFSRRQSPIAHRCKSLRETWKLFETMSASDKHLFELIGKGNSTMSMAQHLAVSRKTVEIRRKKLLLRFGLNNPFHIGHLLCKFQNHGFEDFGI